jgi:DNA repair exonuclease SbcCD ATPase subunit
MAEREIQYQASDGKWYPLTVHDLIDPLAKDLEAKNKELERKLAHWQKTAEDLNESWKTLEAKNKELERRLKGLQSDFDFVVDEKIKYEAMLSQWRTIIEDAEYEESPIGGGPDLDVVYYVPALQIRHLLEENSND